jgi:hypothetical protein
MMPNMGCTNGWESGNIKSSSRIAKVELLGAGKSLIFTRDTGGLAVNLPEKKPNGYAYVLKIMPK